MAKLMTTEAWAFVRSLMSERSMPTAGEPFLALQDAFAQRTEQEIREFHATLTPAERHLFTWMVFRALDADTACRIWERTEGRALLEETRAKYRKELDAEWEDICRARAEHEAAVTKHSQYRKGLWKRMRALERERDLAKAGLSRAEETIQEARARERATRRAAMEQEEELERLRALRDAIRAAL